MRNRHSPSRTYDGESWAHAARSEEREDTDSQPLSFDAPSWRVLADFAAIAPEPTNAELLAAEIAADRREEARKATARREIAQRKAPAAAADRQKPAA
jgi:hypothetical protein